MPPNCAECRHCLANGGTTMYNSGNSNKGEKTTMQNEDMQKIPFYVHESDMARAEKDKERLATINKRITILAVILLVLFVATNGFWIWRETQFEEISMTQEATTDGGGDVIVNGVAQGDLYYGASETDNQNQETENGR